MMLRKHNIFKLLYGVIFLALTLYGCSYTSNTQNVALVNPDKLKPFADIHLHYNWDQEEVIKPADVVQKLKDENVVLGVISSMPSDYALKLRQAAGEWIVPLFSPYITPPHRQSWFLDTQVVELAREGLSSGKYFGIGELHLWSGLPPRDDNKILLALFELARQHDVPFLLHTESSSERYFVTICRQHKDVRILWAHAGGILKPENVARAMKACPNVWVELSARDTWRYDSLVREDGKLPEQWRNLIIEHPDRFMTGSDPVWGVTKTQRWDEPDEGWDHLHNLLNFHRTWLSELPSEVEEKVRLTNAIKFFRANPRQ